MTNSEMEDDSLAKIGGGGYWAHPRLTKRDMMMMVGGSNRLSWS